jgi:hypothetical protein
MARKAWHHSESNRNQIELNPNDSGFPMHITVGTCGKPLPGCGKNFDLFTRLHRIILHLRLETKSAVAKKGMLV